MLAMTVVPLLDTRPRAAKIGCNKKKSVVVEGEIHPVLNTFVH